MQLAQFPFACDPSGHNHGHSVIPLFLILSFLTLLCPSLSWPISLSICFLLFSYTLCLLPFLSLSLSLLPSPLISPSAACPAMTVKNGYGIIYYSLDLPGIVEKPEVTKIINKVQYWSICRCRCPISINNISGRVCHSLNRNVMWGHTFRCNIVWFRFWLMPSVCLSRWCPVHIIVMVNISNSSTPNNTLCYYCTQLTLIPKIEVIMKKWNGVCILISLETRLYTGNRESRHGSIFISLWGIVLMCWMTQHFLMSNVSFSQNSQTCDRSFCSQSTSCCILVAFNSRLNKYTDKLDINVQHTGFKRNALPSET